jgi:hypothetical protein
MEENIQEIERLGRKRKQLLNDVRETNIYWKLTTEALDCSLWRFCFGGGNGPVIRQTWWW